MKVIIAGGGTGGHIFPAISVAEEILGRQGPNDVLFVGTSTGLENELIGKRGYNIKHITARGMKGKGLLKSAGALLSAAKGVSDSLSILKAYRPDVVLGVGGYVSGPMVFAAWVSGIPTAICEQNAYPGVTNRMLGKLVKKVFAAFEDARRFFPRGKVLITGNPIRKDILSGQTRTHDAGTLTILVFGGSQGAHKLNASVPEAIHKLGRSDISVIHQTGVKDFDLVKKAYDSFGISARVLTFIDDMAGGYAEAGFVIARSGAGTVAEITALGKPSLLIPYPFATNDHQLANARALERAGASIVVEDRDATPDNLSRALTNALGKDKLNVMSSSAKSLGRPDAASEVADQLSMLAGAG